MYVDKTQENLFFLILQHSSGSVTRMGDETMYRFTEQDLIDACAELLDKYEVVEK